MKAFLNWRYYVLILFGIIAIVGIVCEPDDGSQTWMRDFMISKAIGFVAICILCKLIGYWSNKNLIPELNEIIKEGEDDLWK